MKTNANDICKIAIWKTSFMFSCRIPWQSVNWESVCLSVPLLHTEIQAAYYLVHCYSKWKDGHLNFTVTIIFMVSCYTRLLGGTLHQEMLAYATTLRLSERILMVFSACTIQIHTLVNVHAQPWKSKK